MPELKPCPFCKCQLTKRHTRYVAITNKIVEYDYWEHPANECILADRICEQGAIHQEDIPAWNRRAEDSGEIDFDYSAED